MPEPVVIKTHTTARFDRDGRRLPTTTAETVQAVVSPAAGSDLEDLSSTGGWESVQVIAPAGVRVSIDDVVVIRGERYKVTRLPWDYSVGRRPVNPRHRPRTVFFADREV